MRKRTKENAIEGTYIGEVKKVINSSFPLKLYRVTAKAAPTPKMISMHVAITATFMLLANPFTKLAEEVKIFAYHSKENPFGGNTTRTVGLKEAKTITTNGAMRNSNTPTVIILENIPTLSSRIFLSSNPLVQIISGEGENKQDKQDGEQEDVAYS